MRSGNFTPSEDKVLCRAWLETSENILVNNSQTSGTFWDRITEVFNQQSPTGRSLRSLSNRWDMLRKVTMKFSGYYNRIANKPPSGSNPANYVKLAKKAYYDNIRKMFTLDHAWEIVCWHEKWKSSVVREPKRAVGLDVLDEEETNPTPSAGPNTSVADASQAPEPVTSDAPPPSGHDMESRPMGIKQAKRKAVDDVLAERKIMILEKNVAEGKKRGSAFACADELQEQSNKISQMEANLKRDSMEVAIMEKDITSLTDEYSKEYFLKRKKKIILKMMEEERQEEENQC
ncbi:hypothetical protein MJO28_009799 [Puccinia striiformis f. sp. tritici]|uniref:Uncharacterized protein n=1 Tax=Puccinia striiformis f. sp. tritici TaxID=168172 RepID=A0ACC0EAC1_9BASI|nr:hypothetical protein MJO28_009799 [Puccinia striiformis f. sp. tritici]